MRYEEAKSKIHHALERGLCIYKSNTGRENGRGDRLCP